MKKEYSRQISKISAIMILQFCLWITSSYLYYFVTSYIFSPLSAGLEDICTELLYVAIYCLSFGVPLLAAKRFLNSENRARFDSAPSKYTPMIVCVSLGVVFAAAILNSIITTPLDSLGFDIFTPDVSMPVTPSAVAVRVISMAIIPAVFEELLFRRVIMGNLAPYGKWQAIFISALLFALMHQNPKQFLYAAIAGVVIGYFVFETNSVLCGIIIHAVNNAVSLLNLVIYNSCSENVYLAYDSALMFAIFASAFVAMPLTGGIAKKEKAPSESVGFLFFRSPLMIVYFLICIGYFILLMVSRILK